MNMPKDYRLEVIETDPGTGHGDENYGLAVQKFEEREVRKGIWPFRRKVKVLGWWTIEVYGNFRTGPTEAVKRAAQQSAWARYRYEMRRA